VSRLSAYYGRSHVPREVLVEDRTKPHADNIGNGIETIAAVGVLKGINTSNNQDKNKDKDELEFSSEMGHSIIKSNRIVKDAVFFHAADYENVINMLKIDVYEPPVAQVTFFWIIFIFSLVL
jgi:lysine-specific demethylase 9